jgi:hypothetical protein
MGPLPLERHKKIRVDPEAATRQRVHLHNPAANTFWVELRVSRAIQRIAEIDARAIAADFEHLRPAIQLATFGMGRVTYDAAELH